MDFKIQGISDNIINIEMPRTNKYEAMISVLICFLVLYKSLSQPHVSCDESVS